MKKLILLLSFCAGFSGCKEKQIETQDPDSLAGTRWIASITQTGFPHYPDGYRYELELSFSLTNYTLTSPTVDGTSSYTGTYTHESSSVTLTDRMGIKSIGKIDGSTIHLDFRISDDIVWEQLKFTKQ